MKMLKNWACLAISVGVCSAPVFAQDMRSASEKVVACQDVSDSLERLACYEAAASELSAVLAAPVPEIVAAPVAPVAPPAPVEQAAIAAPVAPATAPIQQAALETASEAEVPRSRLPSWIPKITFGGDRDVEKEPDEFQTTITRIQRNNIGRHFFTTAEGQVWRQIGVEEIRAPNSLPADAIIYQNMTGGLRLKIVETNRSYSILRVE